VCEKIRRGRAGTGRLIWESRCRVVWLVFWCCWLGARAGRGVARRPTRARVARHRRKWQWKWSLAGRANIGRQACPIAAVCLRWRVGWGQVACARPILAGAVSSGARFNQNHHFATRPGPWRALIDRPLDHFGFVCSPGRLAGRPATWLSAATVSAKCRAGSPGAK
jgi:hypothetical protein